MQKFQESTKTQEQLIEWIVAHVTAFSPSYFERQRIIFVGFLGPDTVFEFDGIEMHVSDQSSLKSMSTKVRKGNERLLFIATMEGDSAFRLRSMGMRGAGGNTLYSFEVIDKVLVMKIESQMIMA